MKIEKGDMVRVRGCGWGRVIEIKYARLLLDTGHPQSQWVYRNEISEVLKVVAPKPEPKKLSSAAALEWLKDQQGWGFEHNDHGWVAWCFEGQVFYGSPRYSTRTKAIVALRKKLRESP